MTLAKVLQLSRQALGTAEKASARDKLTTCESNVESAHSGPGTGLGTFHNFLSLTTTPQGGFHFTDGETEL